MNAKQKRNARQLIDAMAESSIISQDIHIAILCVIMKESRMIPRVESSYKDTPNRRILDIFGKQKLGDFAFGNNELSKLKRSPVDFFSVVYRNVAGNRGRLTDDGYKYRGRGYCQHTGRGNYKMLQRQTGYALVRSPGMLRYSACAAKCAVAFYESQLQRVKIRIQPPSIYLEHPERAVMLIANITAGIGKKQQSKAVQRAYKNALKYLPEMQDFYNSTQG